jgi:uncharacterized protein (TIGR02996 family)
MLFHPDANAFIARLIAAPADTVIRLVFADWLEEMGGVGNENWAKYIRLRTEAAGRHGLDRELLLDDAANVAPHVIARLTLPAARFAPHFVEFMDLLPPDRYTIALADFVGPIHHIRAVGEAASRDLRALVVAERDNLFAVATDRLDPAVALGVSRALLGGIVLFPTWTPDLTAALDRHFPPIRRPADGDVTPVPDRPPTLDELPVKQASARLITEAVGEAARGIEIVALPSGYEVRFQVEGRTLRRYSITSATGEQLVERFFTLSDRSDSTVRAVPRNTSFGRGVTVDLRPR